MRYFFGPLIVVLGFLLIKYTFWITEQTGKIDFADKYLQAPLNGTYTWWRLVGLFLICIAFLWMFGFLDGNTAPELIQS